MENLHPIRKERSLGDSAVDGLTGGLLGGIAMALLLIIAGLFSGTSPAVTLGYFDPAQNGVWLTGLLTHLAISAVYGTLFGLIMRGLKQIRSSVLKYSWLAGIVYGLLLYLVAVGLLFRAVDAAVIQVGYWQFAIAHLLYGLVLGSWFGRVR